MKAKLNFFMSVFYPNRGRNRKRILVSGLYFVFLLLTGFHHHNLILSPGQSLTGGNPISSGLLTGHDYNNCPLCIFIFAQQTPHAPDILIHHIVKPIGHEYDNICSSEVFILKNYAPRAPPAII